MILPFMKNGLNPVATAWQALSEQDQTQRLIQIYRSSGVEGLREYRRSFGPHAPDDLEELLFSRLGGFTGPVEFTDGNGGTAYRETRVHSINELIEYYEFGLVDAELQSTDDETEPDLPSYLEPGHDDYVTAAYQWHAYGKRGELRMTFREFATRLFNPEDRPVSITDGSRGLQ